MVIDRIDSGVATEGVLDVDQLAELRQHFSDNAAWLAAQNGVTQVGIDDVALNRAVVNTTPHTFSHSLDDWEVTSQGMTGRCWMFAGLNLLRVGAMKKMGLKEFEFSQPYVQFWDKLERSNYVLEALIETIDRPLDDRTVAHLLSTPLDDGGQWNMFINLVRKHGVVPKTAMPETVSSCNTRRLNGLLFYKIRECARTMRDRRAAGATIDELRAIKDDQLAVIHRMLCIHFGTPPTEIDWQWKDEDGNFHRAGVLTPQEFAREYITLPIDEFVCLVHDPRPESPLGRTFTVEYLGNVVGGQRVIYLNIDIDLMKSIARDTIAGGEPVWFGCDVGKMMRRDLGMWDKDMFQWAQVYDTEFTLDKPDRLLYGETLMTHAMLFTGVDVLDGAARRWRVENSWGDENGDKGFFVMNDNWFADYTFEIAARKSALPPELQAALEQEPIVLPAWDPMGALAR